VVVCLEQGAGLHMAQLMPLPLTVSCFSTIPVGFTFWYRLTWVVLEKGPLNGCVCVCGRLDRRHNISTGSSNVQSLFDTPVGPGPLPFYSLSLSAVDKRL